VWWRCGGGRSLRAPVAALSGTVGFVRRVLWAGGLAWSARPLGFVAASRSVDSSDANRHRVMWGRPSSTCRGRCLSRCRAAGRTGFQWWTPQVGSGQLARSRPAGGPNAHPDDPLAPLPDRGVRCFPSDGPNRLGLPSPVRWSGWRGFREAIPRLWSRGPASMSDVLKGRATCPAGGPADVFSPVAPARCFVLRGRRRGPCVATLRPRWRHLAPVRRGDHRYGRPGPRLPCYCLPTRDPLSSGPVTLKRHAFRPAGSPGRSAQREGFTSPTPPHETCAVRPPRELCGCNSSWAPIASPRLPNGPNGRRGPADRHGPTGWPASRTICCLCWPCFRTNSFGGWTRPEQVLPPGGPRSISPPPGNPPFPRWTLPHEKH